MNTIGYFEIQTLDPEKAVSFYGRVFGWKFEKDPSIPIEYYRIQNAGLMGAVLKWPTKKITKEQGTNAFTCSIQVENFDETTKKILENGGLVAVPKFPVPGKCWQGYFLDPDKNVLGIFEVDSRAK